MLEAEPAPQPEPQPLNEPSMPEPEPTAESPPLREGSLEDEFVALAEKLESNSLRKVDAFLNQPQKVNVDTLPVLKMDPALEEKVIGLLKEAGTKSAVLSKRGSYTSHDQLVAKLNVTYLSLLRLGFEKSDIEEALKQTFTGESEDTLDWTYTPSYLDSPSMSAPSTTKPRHIPDLNKTAERTLTTKLDSGSKEKEWILQAALLDNSDDEVENPNERYVNYKTAITELAQAQKETSTPGDFKALSRRIDTLNSKLNDLDLDITFDKRLAESMLKQRIIEEKKKAKKDKRKKERPKDLPSDTNVDQSKRQDGDEDDLLGSMMDIEMTANGSLAESSTPSTVKQRRMANPGWTGGTPKTVLSDYCRKKDRHSKISYRKVSGSSEAAVIAAVTVTWANGSTSTTEMKEEGCENMTEAENYVAARLLFELTPLPQYRSFPPTYRDLWLEWSEVKEAESRIAKRETDAERILFIKSLAENLPKKIGTSTQGPGEQSKGQDVESDQSNISEKEISNAGRALQDNWRLRQKKPNYMRLYEKRKELPIFQFREQLLALMKTNKVLIVSGETGCGKSTQVPQYLAEYMLETGLGDHCDIICTQPRRISAISIAHRVSEELGDGRNSAGKPNSLVGYQIRLESCVAPSNILKFCTTGILLRRLESDKNLKGITHLVIDEVHERTLESDFLLIILKKLLSRRPNLRIILMSATVDSARFSQYFDGCPVLEVPGRTFPVHPHFLEQIVEATGYTLEADSEYAIRYRKDIQSKGSVDISGRGASRQTVYLQWENNDDNYYALEAESKVTTRDESTGFTATNRTHQMLNRIDENKINYDLIQLLLEHICFPEYRRTEKGALGHIPEQGAILIFLPGMPEIRKVYDALKGDRRFGDASQFSLWPLHSSISSDGQSQVFDTPPPGVRKIVMATNIAETGITIPDITIVLDTGKAKQIKFDEKKRVTTLQERFIAKANVRQRRGRAGRVQEGVCFHLFSQTTFEDYMPEYQLPEIMRMPLEELCLMIRMSELGDITEVLGSALDAPPTKTIENAIQALQDVGALTRLQELTPLGVHLCNLPVDVHIGKMILFGTIFKCLDPILTIAAMLSFKSPFVTPFGSEEEAEAAKKQFKIADSDMLTWYNAYLGWRKSYQEKPNRIYDYCRKNFLSHQNLVMTEDMKKQFLSFLVSTGFVRIDSGSKQELNRDKFSRRVAFCPVIQDYNVYQRSVPILNAAITAGMYPKIMMRNDVLKAYVTGPKQEISCKVIKDHLSKLVIMDKWIQFKCHAKTAVVFKMMREELDKILQKRIDDPEKDMKDREKRWLDMVVAILEGEEDSLKAEDRVGSLRLKEQNTFLD
ncbi:hypothetical protein BGW38_001480 [Lunasporangiospora selenospora]|uniref:RNA helicase n=1 Tax=Lunasporangiospora selenospora TaxID=979761 RepID=A0A9P6G1G6_9FUNG|nr:hypothetical protein BGW38_001480 [Lunasporangiospora selenospora]